MALIEAVLYDRASYRKLGRLGGVGKSLSGCLAAGKNFVTGQLGEIRMTGGNRKDAIDGGTRVTTLKMAETSGMVRLPSRRHHAQKAAIAQDPCGFCPESRGRSS